MVDDAQLRKLERANGVVVPDLPRGAVMVLDCNLMYAIESTVVPYSPKVLTRWPGNVRELEHAVGRAVLLARGEAIGAEHLPTPSVEDVGDETRQFGDELVPMREMQRRYAAWALERLGGRKMVTCDKLDSDPKTLVRLLAPGGE